MEEKTWQREISTLNRVYALGCFPYDCWYCLSCLENRNDWDDADDHIEIWPKCPGKITQFALQEIPKKHFRLRSELHLPHPPPPPTLFEHPKGNNEHVWVKNFETFCLGIVHLKLALVFQPFYHLQAAVHHLPLKWPLITLVDCRNKKEAIHVKWLLPFVEEDYLSEILVEHPA